jgi:tRNA threonylcarbamoyladenosine biosynthesis protein TsaB
LLENDLVIQLLESEAPNVHTERMTVMIQQVLKAAGIKAWDLDAVAVSDGPGSYTSLRVGLSVAKGLCYTLQKPLITIPSLDILAYGVLSSEIRNDAVIIPMIDARRNEVYAARYNALLHPFTPPLSIILDKNWFDVRQRRRKSQSVFQRPCLCAGIQRNISPFYVQSGFDKIPSAGFQ